MPPVGLITLRFSIGTAIGAAGAGTATSDVAVAVWAALGGLGVAVVGVVGGLLRDWLAGRREDRRAKADDKAEELARANAVIEYQAAQIAELKVELENMRRKVKRR